MFFYRPKQFTSFFSYTVFPVIFFLSIEENHCEVLWGWGFDQIGCKSLSPSLALPIFNDTNNKRVSAAIEVRQTSLDMKAKLED